MKAKLKYCKGLIMPDTYTALSPCCIPVVMHAKYGPQVYNYTCFFAQAPGFSGGYAFVDPEHSATMSLDIILTEQRVHNPAAVEYLLTYHPDLLL